MASLEKLLAWAQHADPDARADAAHQLRSFATDPLSQSEATRMLTTLLCDAHPDVARVALESLLAEGSGRQREARDPPSALAAGLASPHPAIRDSCRDKLRFLSLAWETLVDLGIDPSRAIELVSTEALIAAISDARPWSPLAIQEIAKREVADHLPLRELRQLQRALAGAGSDTSYVTKILDDKRRAAHRNRSGPRASKLGHPSDSLAAIHDEDDEAAHELSYRLTLGDFAALPAESLHALPSAPQRDVQRQFDPENEIPSELWQLIESGGGDPAALRRALDARDMPHTVEMFRAFTLARTELVDVVMSRGRALEALGASEDDVEDWADDVIASGRDTYLETYSSPSMVEAVGHGRLFGVFLSSYEARGGSDLLDQLDED